MRYDDPPEEASDPKATRLRSLSIRAITQGMYDDGARLAMRARAAAMAGRSSEQADPHLSLITYGPAQELVSAAARHLLAHQYEECLHAAELAGALYEFSDASDENLKEYWEIVGLAYRGLGDELGVIGHSGGGTLATWLAQYGDGLFSRVLLLSPYYEPDASKAPKWQMALLRNVYGNHLLPDQFFDGNLSYRALANYVIIKQNYRNDLKAEGLKHLGLIIGSEDDLIDKTMALNIAEGMAKASGAEFTYETTPAYIGAGHELISPEDKVVKKYKEELYGMYLRVYEK